LRNIITFGAINACRSIFYQGAHAMAHNDICYIAGFQTSKTNVVALAHHFGVEGLHSILYRNSNLCFDSQRASFDSQVMLCVAHVFA